jgi:hypothetical protein
LHAAGDPAGAPIADQEMDMIGGHDVVQYAQAEALLSFE